MKKQYLVLAQHKYQEAEKRWSIVFSNPNGSGEAAKVFSRKADAEKAARSYVAQWNKKHTYDAKGERRETFGIGGGLAADMVHTPDSDDRLRVVRWKIRVREVTDWENVDYKEI